MNIDTTYDITKTIKLIDMNGSLVNFISEFAVSSPDPFYIAVVNQKMLDTLGGNDIPFRQPEKEASGTVKYENNEHLQHYIVLKADGNTKVHIRVRTVELPIQSNNPVAQNKNDIPNVSNIAHLIHTDPHSQTQQQTPKKRFNIFILLGLIALAVGAILIFWRKPKKTSQIQASLTSVPTPLVLPPQAQQASIVPQTPLDLLPVSKVSHIIPPLQIPSTPIAPQIPSLLDRVRDLNV
jgi:hypothetical protein